MKEKIGRTYAEANDLDRDYPKHVLTDEHERQMLERYSGNDTHHRVKHIGFYSITKESSELFGHYVKKTAQTVALIGALVLPIIYLETPVNVDSGIDRLTSGYLSVNHDKEPARVPIDYSFPPSDCVVPSRETGLPTRSSLEEKLYI